MHLNIIKWKPSKIHFEDLLVQITKAFRQLYTENFLNIFFSIAGGPMPVVYEVKEETEDDQEIIDLANKIKEANRAKLAQAASYQTLPLRGTITMARPGQPAIQQYFNGTAAAPASGQVNGTAINGRAADVSDKPVDEESKESCIKKATVLLVC
jgi:hypothetical protein